MRADQSRLDATHFRVAGRIRLSQDLMSHGEVSPLLKVKSAAISRPSALLKVVMLLVRSMPMYLPVRVPDLVDDLGPSAYDVRSLRLPAEQGDKGRPGGAELWASNRRPSDSRHRCRSLVAYRGCDIGSTAWVPRSTTCSVHVSPSQYRSS
jgi:hypothetical protein